jgi:hypothetical protein
MKNYCRVLMYLEACLYISLTRNLLRYFVRTLEFVTNVMTYAKRNSSLDAKLLGAPSNTQHWPRTNRE